MRDTLQGDALQKAVRHHADTGQKITDPLEAMLLSDGVALRSAPLQWLRQARGAAKVTGKRRSSNSGLISSLGLRFTLSCCERRELLLHSRNIPEQAQHGIRIGLPALRSTAAER